MKKVLIVAGGLQMGGAERVAANISKYAPEGEFEFHYLVFEGYDNVYGPEIEKDGGKVLTWPAPGKGYGEYIKRLGKLIDENRYVAVHSHTMFNSGINLAVAKKHGVPVRIAHSHTTETEHKVSFLRKIYENSMRRKILSSCTELVACGVDAGNWMFGKEAFSRIGTVVNNGIDTEMFSFSEESRKKIREEYGLGNRFVIGHSGTLIPLKNQEFLIRLMPSVLEKKDAVLMLMGMDCDGEMKRLHALARELKVSENVIFTGGVMNLYDYLSAFDVFAFPSLREGTPLAMLEAQANGLPCIVSDAVPDDAFITEIATKCALDDIEKWVESIIGALRNSSEAYAGKVSEAGYSVKTAYLPIYEMYRGKYEK